LQDDDFKFHVYQFIKELFNTKWKDLKYRYVYFDNSNTRALILGLGL
jgi:hypothetical protein